MSNRRKIKVNVDVLISHTYLWPRRAWRPWRPMIGEIRRPWLRYLIVQTAMIKLGRSVAHSRARVTPVALVWTRRQAERVVNELRRSA